jgi:hypothetical protein
MSAGYKRWQDIRGRGKSPERLARVAGAVERELLEMDLRAVRKLLGKSQAEVARAPPRRGLMPAVHGPGIQSGVDGAEWPRYEPGLPARSCLPRAVLAHRVGP